MKYIFVLLLCWPALAQALSYDTLKTQFDQFRGTVDGRSNALETVIDDTEDDKDAYEAGLSSCSNSKYMYAPNDTSGKANSNKCIPFDCVVDGLVHNETYVPSSKPSGCPTSFIGYNWRGLNNEAARKYQCQNGVVKRKQNSCYRVDDTSRTRCVKRRKWWAGGGCRKYCTWSTRKCINMTGSNGCSYHQVKTWTDVQDCGKKSSWWGWW